MRILVWVLALLALLTGASAARAQMPPMEIHVHAKLEAETTHPAPGDTVTLAFEMRPDPGWHDYWLNPADAGQGLTAEWTLPPGVTAGPIRFPVPETLITLGYMNYIYKSPHAMLVDLKLPADIAPGARVPISVWARWMACSDTLCVPQEGVLTTELVVGDGKVGAASRTRFDQWRAALPVPLDREARYAVTGKTIQIAIPYPAKAALADPWLFPVTLDLFDYVAPQNMRRAGDWLVVETRLSKQHKGAPPEQIEGLLRIGKDQGLLFTARAGEVPSGGVAVAQTADSTTPQTPPLYILLFGALLGGLLLNIMPCVFPILGLKALALAKAGGDERAARNDALAYTAGVVLSCIALGGIMLALRAGGEEIGWAFQLQSPGFVLFLLLLMVGVTANLAGLFELRGFEVGHALTRNPGLLGSFWTGVLAALVATPCTGPFMAAALGAALLLPTAEALILFATLGLGIALPFLAIAFVPALRNRLPKPGPWLSTFRKAMAIPMGLTALALLWLLGQLMGPPGLLGGTFAALMLIGVILLGHFTSRKVALIAVALFLGATALGLYVLVQTPLNIRTREIGVLPSQSFDEKRLAELRSEKTPVFVYFTADWCVTCKINEATVLERAATAKLFSEKGVMVLRGDFTRRDPAIARFLAQHGHAGVPLYLYYPRDGEPKILPQILTTSVLVEALGG